MNHQDLVFYVGKDKKIMLEGVLLEPSLTNIKSNIVFSPGISSDYRDYMGFLQNLAEDARVIAYNLRGHGKSQGVFDPQELINDLEQITREQALPTCLVGHSIGAGISTCIENKRVKGCYLLNPYIESDFLRKKSRFGAYALRALTFLPGPLQIADGLLYISGLGKKLGFNNRKPLQDIGRLTKMRILGGRDIPIAWIAAENDELLGPREYIRSELNKIYRGEDRSGLAENLNHCFNLKRGDYAPFLKEEPGKNREGIIRDILEFSKLACNFTA